MIFLKFIDEIPLVVGELGLVYEVRLPQVSDNGHNVSFVGQRFHAVAVKRKALYSFLYTDTFLAAASDPRKEVSKLTIAVSVIVALPTLEFVLDFVREVLYWLLALRVFFVRTRIGAGCIVVICSSIIVINPVGVNILV